MKLCVSPATDLYNLILRRCAIVLDPVTAGIIAVLGKYVPDQGAELGQTAGPKALDTAKAIVTAALDRLRRTPKGQMLAEGFMEDATTYEKPVTKELEKAINEDAAFKAQMATLLTQFDRAAAAHAATTGTTYTAVLRGSGAIAQGEDATAVGERGVNVGGSVGGSIVTGSGATIHNGRSTSSPTSLPPELAFLRNNLVRYFNESELNALSFDLGVAPDDLPNETRTELAQALVAYAHRHNRLADLIDHCRAKRPHVRWSKDR